MNKTWLVTQREFTTRARKKSYLIMTFLGPVIIAGFFTGIFFLARPQEDKTIKKIAVLDSSMIFRDRLQNTDKLQFVYLNDTKANFLNKETLLKSGFYGVLYISPAVTHNTGEVQFYSEKQPGLTVTEYISGSLDKILRQDVLKIYHLENIEDVLNQIKSRTSLQTFLISAEGGTKSSSTGLSMGLAYISSLLIYMFILMYGVQVMRGVIEEKTNRIVEVVISSVKPFELMMGKVLGVAMAALIQFIAWIVLTFTFITIIKGIFLPELTATSVAAPPQSLMDSTAAAQHITTVAPQANPELLRYLGILGSYNYFLIVGCFLFYFVGGYLLYSSLFASVGAAVDNETDTQQFVFPITLPLILAIMVMISAFQNPDSSLAFWFSMFPLTSPVVMMARLPFGVPWPELVSSMALLVLTFIGSIWMAAKIYRTGILMYGKKVNIKEIIKWLKYKS